MLDIHISCWLGICSDILLIFNSDVWFLIFYDFLKIFLIQVFPQIGVMQILSPSLACIFILLRVSLVEQKVFILTRSPYHIFLSWSALLVPLKRSLPTPMSKIYSSSLSSRYLIVMYLI